MLKKLVKYGNSNALVIDKAILEILNIQEGATVKIKTDGTSIIITPQDARPAEQVSETYTAADAMSDSVNQELLKHYRKTNSPVDNEVAALVKQKGALLNELKKHANYAQNIRQEAETLKKQKKYAHASEDDIYLKALENVKHQLKPELNAVEKKLDALTSQHNLLPQNNMHQKAMTKEMMELNKRHTQTLNALHEMMSDSEFIHQNQLLAERFKGDQNSKAFIQACQELHYQFVPALKGYHEEMQTITKKYTPKKQ